MNHQIRLSPPEAAKLLGPKKLDEINKDDALAFVKQIASPLFENDITIPSTLDFDLADDSPFSGYINWYAFPGEINCCHFFLDIDTVDGYILFWTEKMDLDEQIRDIQEILASTVIQPGLDEFLAAMSEKLKLDGIDFGDAWNEVVFDYNGNDTDLGIAFADFRDEYLIKRLGYEPNSEALDDAIEQWILNRY